MLDYLRRLFGWATQSENGAGAESRSIEIQLDRKPGEVEDYMERDENVAQVRVQVPTDHGPQIVCDDRYIAELTLNRDAMLGLGKALIREAYRSEEAFVRLRPADSSAAQAFGIYLLPNSCGLIISEGELGTLQNALDEKGIEIS
jgi:hypothetical protein